MAWTVSQSATRGPLRARSARLSLLAIFSALLTTLIEPTPGIADIKDYEIMRFLYLKTACGRSSIVQVERINGQLHFRADCQDKTSFPDGAIVVCSDLHDDRSCILQTAPAGFPSLRLLQPD